MFLYFCFLLPVLTSHGDFANPQQSWNPKTPISQSWQNQGKTKPDQGTRMGWNGRGPKDPKQEKPCEAMEGRDHPSPAVPPTLGVSVL